jgi:hypothetical protein
MSAPIRKMTLKQVFSPGNGNYDFRFTDNSITYLGKTVETIFNELYIYNGLSATLYYSIERDENDLITVGSAATQGVNEVIKSTSMREDIVQIDRLRIVSSGTGYIYIVLHNNPRPKIT